MKTLADISGEVPNNECGASNCFSFWFDSSSSLLPSKNITSHVNKLERNQFESSRRVLSKATEKQVHWTLERICCLLDRHAFCVRHPSKFLGWNNRQSFFQGRIAEIWDNFRSDREVPIFFPRQKWTAILFGHKHAYNYLINFLKITHPDVVSVLKITHPDVVSVEFNNVANLIIADGWVTVCAHSTNTTTIKWIVFEGL